MNSANVRRLSAAEADRPAWAAVRDLCCRTGDNGDPIAPERNGLFSRIWIEPYETLLPEWSYVAEAGGSVVGYLTGCPETSKFLRRKLWRMSMPLVLAIVAGRYHGVPGAAPFVKQELGIRRSLERRFGPSLQREILITYPAHLHINIDSSHRRTGIGRRLMDAYCTDLRRQGVPGLHLYCGPDPVPFYRRLGFRILECVEVRGNTAYAMAMHL